jgi:hypothetical protein
MTIAHIGALSLQVDGEDTRRGFVEGLITQIEASVRYVVRRCTAETLEAEVTVLLGREWYERREYGGPRRAPARCKQCGSRYPQDFRRDGHYTRYLDTGWGRLEICVPQMECICGGTVTIPFRTLRSRQRMWDDLKERYKSSTAGE